MDVAVERTDSRRVRFFRDSARDQAIRLTQQIFGGAVLVACCLWGFIAWSLWSEYDHAKESARLQEYNLVAALSNDLHLTFDSIVRSFRLIQYQINVSRPPFSWPAVLPHLEEEGRLLAVTDRDLRIADANGRLVLVSGQSDPPANIETEAHFKHHRDNPSDELMIEASGGGHHSQISVTKRLQTPDGRFAGEATIMIPLDRLLNSQRDIDLGRRGMIMLSNPQGTVLAGFDRHHPDGSVGIGLDLKGGPFPSDLKPGQTAYYSRKSKVDGVERLIAIRRLPQYDLRVLVASEIDSILAPARLHVWQVSLVGLGATALINVLSWLLVREVWHRTRKEIELASDRERLHLAQAQIEVERSRLADTNRELVASKERAESASRTKSQFLAHMSHELRTPLHAIIGFSELIRDQAPSKAGAPPIAGYAADILTSGRHLLDLINTILDITKIESGTATLAESQFPVGDVIRNALITIKAQADTRNITIDVKQPDIPLRLFADRTRLLQILINLLSNALKFTPSDGSITVSIARDPCGEVVLAVIDSGVGMTPAEVQVALEPFGQVDNALSRSYQGTGLGLPLASRLVEMHGGRLELTSMKGKGTVARVILPARRVAERAGAVA